MNFRSVAQLSDQIVNWSKTLPRDLEVVVGIPRSGLLAANLLALYRNLPLADLDGFLEGRCISAGSTRGNPLAAEGEDPDEAFLAEPRSVLVLDDSVRSGGTVRQVRARIEAAGLPHRVRYGAVYVLPEATDAVDYYCEELHAPRAFEWNVLNHHTLRTSCVDMDGVLCYDPDGHENDDGERYLDFLRTTPPLLRPPYPIGHIVTNRLERYRPETEAWLHENGIEYGELIMLDYPDGATRRQMNAYSAHKAQAYRRTGAALFIESDVRQAVEIAALAKKDVLCIDTMQLITPGSLPVARPGWPLEPPPAPSLPLRIARRVIPGPAKEGLRRLRKLVR